MVGRNPARKMHEFPVVNNGIFTISTGDRPISEPSTVAVPYQLVGKIRMVPQQYQLSINPEIWLSQWPTFKLLVITYLIGKIEFKLYFMVLWLSKKLTSCKAYLFRSFSHRIVDSARENKKMAPKSKTRFF